MCTRGYLTRLDKDLSYLIWRSSVHQYSVSEVTMALDTLKNEAVKRCPDNNNACRFAEDIFESHQVEIQQLLERAKLNPPSGMVGDG